MYTKGQMLVATKELAGTRAEKGDLIQFVENQVGSYYTFPHYGIHIASGKGIAFDEDEVEELKDTLY